MRPFPLRFVCAALIVIMAGCQSPGTTFSQSDLDAAETEVEAQLDAFWEAWLASSFDEGMAYYSDDPGLSFITDGFIWESKAAAEAAYGPFFAGIERQELDESKTLIVALAPQVVQVTQAATYVQYFRSGEVSPPRSFALSMTWVKEEGEWKVMTYHLSMPNPAPATLKSVHLFNLPPNAEESVLVEALATANAGVRQTGFQNAGYDLWKVDSAQLPESAPVGFGYLMEGIWPDQAAYDEIHAAEAFIAAGEASRAIFDLTATSQLYSRFVRMDVGGPGER
jgi:ketosteroid isomerase-like protein